MDSDISGYRASDGRPLLKDGVVPHLNLYNDAQNISASKEMLKIIFCVCFPSICVECLSDTGAV